MMADKKNLMKISELWIRILNKMDADERVAKDFGTTDLLHCSEIHTIMAIGKNPDINVTSLSTLLGISKSAISQMTAKLLKKGLVEKFRDPENEKEIRLRLSPKGTIAYLGHEQHHAKIYAQMHQNLGDLSDAEFAFIIRFLTAMEKTIDGAGHGRG